MRLPKTGFQIGPYIHMWPYDPPTVQSASTRHNCPSGWHWDAVMAPWTRWQPPLHQELGCHMESTPGAPDSTSARSSHHCSQTCLLPDVFLLVILSDGHISAIGFQFMLKNPPESIVFHAEGMIQHWCDVILSVDIGEGWLGLSQRVLGGGEGRSGRLAGAA